MNRVLRDRRGYTLIESLVAMTLFVTAILGVLNSMSGFMVSPRTKVLQAALIVAQDELAHLSVDSLYAGKNVKGKFIVEKVVTPQPGYVDVTLIVSAANDQGRPLITITKLMLPEYE